MAGIERTQNAKNFVNVREAAAHIGVCSMTMYKLARLPLNKGGPPTRRFGKNIRFPKQKFIDWADNGYDKRK